MTVIDESVLTTRATVLHSMLRLETILNSVPAVSEERLPRNSLLGVLLLAVLLRV